MSGKLKVILNLLIIACANSQYSQYVAPNYAYPYYMNPPPIYAPQPVSNFWPMYPNIAVPRQAIPYPYYPNYPYSSSNNNNNSNLNQSRVAPIFNPYNNYYPYQYVNSVNPNVPLSKNSNGKEAKTPFVPIPYHVRIPTKIIDVPNFNMVQGLSGQFGPSGQSKQQTKPNSQLIKRDERQQLYQVPAQIVIKDPQQDKDIGKGGLKVITIPKITKTNIFHGKPITATIVRTFNGNEKPEVHVTYMNGDNKVVDALSTTSAPETTTEIPETTTVDETPVAINSWL